MRLALSLWLLLCLSPLCHGGEASTDGAVRSRTAPDRTMDADCVAFDPESVTAHGHKGSWTVADGRTRLFDFGNDQAAAKRAVAVIHHYRMNRRCWVGGPEGSFSYLLAKGGAPAGPMDQERCVPFAPERLTLAKLNGTWTMLSGRRPLFVFGRHESDAQAALAVIRRHGFDHACHVGRTAAGFIYLRR